MQTEKKFKASERLKSRKAIEGLFASRESPSIGQYPLRLIYQPQAEKTEGRPPVQMAVSVPKRKFRRASARNRIRRQVKEAWRLNKHRLYEALPADGPHYAFMLLYVAKEPLPYAQMERAVRLIIRKFIKH